MAPNVCKSLKHVAPVVALSFNFVKSKRGERDVPVSINCCVQYSEGIAKSPKTQRVACNQSFYPIVWEIKLITLGTNIALNSYPIVSIRSISVSHALCFIHTLHNTHLGNWKSLFWIENTLWIVIVDLSLPWEWLVTPEILSDLYAKTYVLVNSQ